MIRPFGLTRAGGGNSRLRFRHHSLGHLALEVGSVEFSLAAISCILNSCSCWSAAICIWIFWSSACALVIATWASACCCSGVGPAGFFPFAEEAVAPAWRWIWSSISVPNLNFRSDCQHEGFRGLEGENCCCTSGAMELRVWLRAVSASVMSCLSSVASASIVELVSMSIL